MADICDRCGYPVIQNNLGHWVHASIADGYFCDLMTLAARTDPPEYQHPDGDPQ